MLLVGGVLSLTEIFATVGVLGVALAVTALVVEVVMAEEFEDPNGVGSGGGGFGSVAAVFGGTKGGSEGGDSSFFILLEEIGTFALGGLGFLAAGVAFGATACGGTPICCGGGFP